MPRARASVTGADTLGRGRRLRSKTTAFFCCHFRRRFPAVAGVAKRLQVVGVDKQRPHAAVRDDVVNVGSTCTHPTHGTGTAERLPQELLRAQVILEDRQAVPLVPVSGLCASAGGVLGLVLWAVHLPRQHTAADVCARPEWLLCHGLSPPGKTKTPEPSHLSVMNRLRRVGSGSLLRYSRWTLCGSFCSTPRFVHLWSLAKAAEPFASGKSGKANIHLLLSFYHTLFLIAILFTSKKFCFPINKHYPKSEINARLSVVVSAGSIHSINVNSPYPLVRVCASITSAPGGAVSRSEASTHPQ